MAGARRLGRLLAPAAALAALLVGLAPAARAQSVSWCVDMSGAEIVPPVNSPATGTAIITLDTLTHVVSWWVEHENITGIHNATHFHGPALPGQNGPVILNLGVGNPVVGSAQLSPPEAADLMAGLWYVMLHSTAFPQGEIRGQVDDSWGKSLCDPQPNSFSPSGADLVPGGKFAVADDALTLTAVGVPPGEFGYLLIGQGMGTVQPPGSSGDLCLAGAAIGRYTQQVLAADAAGVMGPFTPSLQSLPNPPGGSVMVGDIWGFQAWFRDGGTNNFSEAFVLVFLQ